MNKKNKLIISFSLLFLFSASLDNLCATTTTSNRWKYGAIGCGVATAASAIGLGYKYIQLRKNKKLLNKSKKLSPTKLEEVLKQIESNKRWMILFVFTTAFSVAGTAVCLYKWINEKDNNDSGGNNNEEHKPEFIHNCHCNINYICDNDDSGETCLKLSCGCKKHSCQPCLKAMVQKSINQKGSSSIELRCSNCRKMLSDQDIRDILHGDKNKTKLLSDYYESLFRQWQVKNKGAENTRVCPGLNCGVPYFFEINAQFKGQYNRVICTSCNHQHCGNCLKDHGFGTRCESGNGNNNSATGNIATSNLLRNVDRDHKYCPNCVTIIHRAEGCDHVKCNCGVSFCFNCYRRYYETGKPYDHYNCPAYNCLNPWTALPPKLDPNMQDCNGYYAKHSRANGGEYQND